MGRAFFVRCTLVPICHGWGSLLYAISHQYKLGPVRQGVVGERWRVSKRLSHKQRTAKAALSSSSLSLLNCHGLPDRVNCNQHSRDIDYAIFLM